jgi:hypothetical protein
MNGNTASRGSEFPPRALLRAVEVSGASQRRQQVALCKRLAVKDASRSGIHLGGIAENFSGKPRIDHARVRDVVIGEDARAHQQEQHAAAQQADSKSRCPEAS